MRASDAPHWLSPPEPPRRAWWLARRIVPAALLNDAGIVGAAMAAGGIGVAAEQ